MTTFYLSLLLALCSQPALWAQAADIAWRLCQHPDTLFSLRYPPDSISTQKRRTTYQVRLFYFNQYR
jgi:hypothetical protein